MIYVLLKKMTKFSSKRAWSSGYDVRLTRERSRVRSSVLVLLQNDNKTYI